MANVTHKGICFLMARLRHAPRTDARLALEMVIRAGGPVRLSCSTRATSKFLFKWVQNTHCLLHALLMHNYCHMFIYHATLCRENILLSTSIYIYIFIYTVTLNSSQPRTKRHPNTACSYIKYSY